MLYGPALAYVWRSHGKDDCVSHGSGVLEDGYTALQAHARIEHRSILCTYRLEAQYPASLDQDLVAGEEKNFRHGESNPGLSRT